MGIRFNQHRHETVASFFKNEVSCAVFHLKNGDSFTFYNDTFKLLSYNANNENVIMKAVCKVNKKLNNE
jgi:beta-galactosidase beta subunit